MITLRGQPELRPQAIAVPRDPSSAAFPVAAALLVEGSEMLLPGIGLNPTRAGLYETLVEMGADIELRRTGARRAASRSADLTVRFAALKGIEVPPERAASMIDEYPILAALAATADGRDGDARHPRAAGQGERPDRRDGARARGLRHQGRGGAGLSDRARPRARAACRAARRWRAGSTTASPWRSSASGWRRRRRSPSTTRGPIATSFPGFVPLMRGLGAEIERVKTGGCLCGAVRYRVDGPLDPVVACHCTQCRRSTGHHAAATGARREDVTIDGDGRLVRVDARRDPARVLPGLRLEPVLGPDRRAEARHLGGHDRRRHRAAARRAHLRGRQGRLLRRSPTGCRSPPSASRGRGRRKRRDGRSLDRRGARLIYFPGSPFARMARVLVREWRLADRRDARCRFRRPTGSSS